jgi:hypothetical protein
LLQHPSAADRSTPVAKAPITTLLQDQIGTKLAEGVFWRKDGTSFPAEYSIAPIWEQDRLIGTVVTFKDAAGEPSIGATLRPEPDVTDTLLSYHWVSDAAMGCVQCKPSR